MLAGWLRQRLLPWLASAVIVLGGAVLALLWISDGARSGFTTDQLLQVIAALAVMVWPGGRERQPHLAARCLPVAAGHAFAVTRRAAQERNPVEARRLFAEVAATRLSELRDNGADDEPGLVICGTANINADREVPPDSGGFCISFDPEHVTLRRETCAEGEDHVRALTSDYEALVGQRRTTLFDISAISGAAVSPLMGSATQQAYRILLTARTSASASGCRTRPWSGKRVSGSNSRRRAAPGNPTGGGRGGHSFCCCGTCRRTRSGTVRRT